MQIMHLKWWNCDLFQIDMCSKCCIFVCQFLYSTFLKIFVHYFLYHEMEKSKNNFPIATVKIHVVHVLFLAADASKMILNQFLKYLYDPYIYIYMYRTYALDIICTCRTFKK